MQFLFSNAKTIVYLLLYNIIIRGRPLFYRNAGSHIHVSSIPQEKCPYDLQNIKPTIIVELINSSYHSYWYLSAYFMSLLMATLNTKYMLLNK